MNGRKLRRALNITGQFLLAKNVGVLIRVIVLILWYGVETALPLKLVRGEC